MRHSKAAHILTTQAADGLGAVQLIDNATGRVLAHQGYLSASQWNWSRQIVVKQAEYLGYKIVGEQTVQAPAFDVDKIGEATGDEDYQLALAMDPGDHDYQLGLGI